MSKFRLSTGLIALLGLSLGGLSTASAQGQPGQQDPRGQQTLEQQAQGQDERYEARRTSPRSAQKSVSVTEALAMKLKMHNEAEIELAQMAKQMSDKQEVQQFASSIIENHQALNKKLMPILNKQASGQQAAGQQRGRRTGQATDPRLSDQPRIATATVPGELIQVGQQAFRNALEMNKEMLREHQDKDFAMAFVGQQIMAHTMMLAELKAIESTGPGELQPIAQQAIPKVEDHLAKAKQLAEQLSQNRQG